MVAASHTLIESIEKVQKRAVKLILKSNVLSYEERLKILNLPTLKFRRLRGDMIEVSKIVNGIYDRSTTIEFALRRMFNARK